MEINSPTQDDRLVGGSPPPGKPPAEGMVWIPGGTFLMGSDVITRRRRPRTR